MRTDTDIREPLPVNEELWLAREVIVDDIVDKRYVNTTSCDICGDQHADLAGAELGHVDLTSSLQTERRQQDALLT